MTNYNFNINNPHAGMIISPSVNHQIMANVRDSYYQHPGEEDAIELLFKNIGKNREQNLLDVGCGCGGTANYLQSKGWGKIVGIDINPEVIKIANENFCNNKANTNLQFFQCDVVQLENFLTTNTKIIPPTFEVIYSFNVMFLFPNHIAALQQLVKAANDATKLLIFDYVDYGNYNKQSYLENDKPLLPNTIKSDAIETTFAQAGWKINSIETIDNLYTEWYSSLMQKIALKTDILNKKFGIKTIAHYTARYQHLLDSLKDGLIGGVIIKANK